MTKVVSIIPPKSGHSGTRVQGTKVLLDNGEYLRCVSKVTLIADMDHGLWKAVLEVFPTNQQQIDAVLHEMVTKPNQGVIIDRAEQIKKQMADLQAELDEMNHDEIKEWDDYLKNLGAPGEGKIESFSINGEPVALPISIPKSVKGEADE